MIRRTLIRDLPDRSRIVAKIDLREAGDPGPFSPAFSVTGETYEPRGNYSGASRHRRGFNIDTGGCLHEDILKHWPELAPLVELHLSNSDGVPMHAEANAWYFATDQHVAYELKHYGADYVNRHGTGIERAKRILRVDRIPVEALEDREAFAAWVETLRPQWLEEARKGRELLESLSSDKP